jgi:serine/threonine protein kinase
LEHTIVDEPTRIEILCSSLSLLHYDFDIAKPPTPKGFQWKIHVSSSVETADETLRITISCAKENKFYFKCVASKNALSILNKGRFGFSQIGKYITIYPRNDNHLNEIVRSLSKVLPPSLAPRIPFDNETCAHENIFLRYGAFSQQLVRDPLGNVVPGIVNDIGDVMPDLRTARATGLALGRLQVIGLSIKPENDTKIVGGRYIMTDLLRHGPRGKVFIGVDTKLLKTVVIKTAHKRDLIGFENSVSAFDCLLDEYSALVKISELKIAPFPYLLTEDGEQRYLVMQNIHGITLKKHLEEKYLGCRPIDLAEASLLVSRVRECLLRMERLGIYHRDVSPSNILITEIGDINFVDFENFVDRDKGVANVWSGGTPGFFPEGDKGVSRKSLVFRRDYSIAALLFFALVGRAPYHSYDSELLTLRHILNSAIPQSLLDELSPLKACNSGGRDMFKPSWEVDELAYYGGASGRLAAEAAGLGVYLPGDAEKATINTDVLKRIGELPIHPGFYVGTLGTIFALRHSNIPASFLSSLERQCLSTPNRSPDMLNGRAGQLRYLCMQFQHQGRPASLEAAQKIASDLVQEYLLNVGGWRIPDGYGSLSNKVFYGYAHGSSGIADCLLDYWKLTGCSDALTVIYDVHRNLLTRSRAPNGCWIWTAEGGKGGGPSWCHGAVGIGRFYINFHKLEPEISKNKILEIAKYIWRYGKSQEASYCHGMAGNADFLFDAAQLLNCSILEGYSKDFVQCHHFSGLNTHGPKLSLFTGQLGVELIRAKVEDRKKFDIVRYFT